MGVAIVGIVDRPIDRAPTGAERFAKLEDESALLFAPQLARQPTATAMASFQRRWRSQSGAASGSRSPAPATRSARAYSATYPVRSSSRLEPEMYADDFTADDARDGAMPRTRRW